MASPSSEEIKALYALFDRKDYPGAEALARRLIERFPQDGFVWKAMGLLLNMQGKKPESLEAMQRAAQLLPKDAEAHSNLGVVLKEQGRLAEAEACYRKALAIHPDFADAWNNLGNTLRAENRFAEAEADYRRAIAINPHYTEAHANLCGVLYDQGRLAEAEVSGRRALAINPHYAAAHNLLGNVFQGQDRLADAESCYRLAMKIESGSPDAYSNLSVILKERGRLREAEECCRHALSLNPDFAEACCNLGNVLMEQERFAEAEDCHRRALAINPNMAEACNNLGNVLKEMGRLTEADSCYRRTLEINPRFAEAYNNLGNAVQEQGRLAEAEALYRRAIEIKPDYTGAHSNLLFTLNFTGSGTHDSLKQARDYGRLVSGKAQCVHDSWPCDPAPERLRVGLVSGDVRHHPVGYFLDAFIPRIDSTRIEWIAYPSVQIEDDLTARLKPFFSAWKPLPARDDEAARMIHADGLHLLLDLSGHTRNNRLPLFAWKPAPVQATWLGYFATTGVAEMDYIIGDPHVTPQGEENHFTETVWRLPECYACLAPPDAAVEVGPLPALTAGCVTFGCFNNLTKMNDAVVALWTRALDAVPGSRLFLKTRPLNDPAMRDAVRARFADHGVDPERLILEGSSPRVDLLSAYNRVDIALDPFPYPGGVTSMEALWMGVPVITRRGDRFLSHVGEGIAHNAGMADWIAGDDDDYVSKAVSKAADLAALSELRSGLRPKLMASPLFDAPRFARHLEEALWGMWKGKKG